MSGIYSRKHLRRKNNLLPCQLAFLGLCGLSEFLLSYVTLGKPRPLEPSGRCFSPGSGPQKASILPLCRSRRLMHSSEPPHHPALSKCSLPLSQVGLPGLVCGRGSQGFPHNHCLSKRNHDWIPRNNYFLQPRCRSVCG